MQWNPGHYEQFKAHRERPGRDLLAGIPAITPSTIIDLGCGTGYLTRALAARFPDALTIGLDSDAAMLAKAASVASNVRWCCGNIGSWQADAPVDLIFSNAALHWLPDHRDLFARMAGMLAPGGVLAVQMPNNFQAPSHRLLMELAGQGDWADALAGALDHGTVLDPAEYWQALSGIGASVDIWQTEYLQVLTGDDPVLGFVSGTALLPVLARLPVDQADRFRTRYAEGLRQAYPRQPDGSTLFPFRRLFILARIADTGNQGRDNSLGQVT